MDDLSQILEEFGRLKDACTKMSKKKIVVGIIAGEKSEVMAIAHAHEYGVPGKLPERSFIRASFDKDKDKLADIVTGQVDKVLAGQRSPEAAAAAIGAQAAQLVQNFIDDNRVTPPSDFSKKTQKTTLYETGTHIRDRITFDVEDK